MHRKLDINEVRNIMLDILNDVTSFCDEHSITYYLACGTLLGAIKYNGFIPWDDDVDIMMPRPDFERFNKEYINNKYKALTPEQGQYFFTKVYDSKTIIISNKIDQEKYKPIGVNIDVFPLDGIVNDEKIVSKLQRKANFLESILSLSKQRFFYRKNPIKAINRVIARIIGSKRLISMITRNAKTYDYDNSDYVIRFRKTSNGFTGALPKDVYEVTKHTFEGKEYNVPMGYDLWLKRFYGKNYKELEPEESKRKIHIREIYYN